MEHRFTFRLDSELFAKLVKYCYDNKRSVNNGLKFLLERDMERYFQPEECNKQYNESK